MSDPAASTLDSVGWISRPAAARPRRVRRALLVDTDEPTLDVIGHRLTRAGFSVATERTGPDALVAIDREAPDVVVAGARLPGLDGLGLFQQLEARLDLPPPVVLVFWPGNGAAIAEALDAGVADVVVRPLSLAEVVARIARLA